MKKLGFAFYLPLTWIVLVLSVALSADWLPLAAPDRMDWNRPAAPPGTRGSPPAKAAESVLEAASPSYLLGTDTMGRDMVSRLIFGARVSLSVGLLSPLIGLVIGGMLGMLAGFYRGWLDGCITAAMDTILAFPGLVLLLAITYFLGPGLQNLLLTLGFFCVPAFCRVARAKTLALANREFVQATRMMGASNGTLLFGEILPNILISLVIYALFMVALMIMVEGALSFLGLGIAPPTPSWGGMIAEGQEVLDEAPHVTLVPASAMFLTVLAFNLMADQLRHLYDPKEQQL